MDVPTRWNSSFLAWERLLLIKDAIDIVITILTVSSTQKDQKDAKRLKEIQLTDDEWDLMKDLVDILGPFFETTEKLGGSEYITISYILSSILGLMRNLTSSTNYTDDELNLSDSDAFLVCLLDPRCKKLKFAAPTQRHQAETALRNKYNEVKSLHKASTSSDKSFSPCEDQDKQEGQRQIYQKSFFKSIFMQDTSEDEVFEIEHLHVRNIFL
ncbi:41951_t:CDS:2, partial [Gigaspora margarita]